MAYAAESVAADFYPEAFGEWTGMRPSACAAVFIKITPHPACEEINHVIK